MARFRKNDFFKWTLKVFRNYRLLVFPCGKNIQYDTTFIVLLALQFGLLCKSLFPQALELS